MTRALDRPTEAPSLGPRPAPAMVPEHVKGEEDDDDTISISTVSTLTLPASRPQRKRDEGGGGAGAGTAPSSGPSAATSATATATLPRDFGPHTYPNPSPNLPPTLSYPAATLPRAIVEERPLSLCEGDDDDHLASYDDVDPPARHQG